MPIFEKLTLPNEGEIITLIKANLMFLIIQLSPLLGVMVPELIFGLQLKSFLIQLLKKAMEMKEKSIGLKSMQEMRRVKFMALITIYLKILLKQLNTLV